MHRAPLGKMPRRQPYSPRRGMWSLILRLFATTRAILVPIWRPGIDKTDRPARFGCRPVSAWRGRGRSLLRSETEPGSDARSAMAPRGARGRRGRHRAVRRASTAGTTSAPGGEGGRGHPARSARDQRQAVAGAGWAPDELGEGAVELVVPAPVLGRHAARACCAPQSEPGDVLERLAPLGRRHPPPGPGSPPSPLPPARRAWPWRQARWVPVGWFRGIPRDFSALGPSRLCQVGPRSAAWGACRFRARVIRCRLAPAEPDIVSERSDPPQRATSEELEIDALARRKLLKLTVYAVPAVIGTFSLHAAAQATCTPPLGCPPNSPCPPDCRPQCDP